MSPINATSRMKINMPPIPQLRLSGANAKGLLKMYIEHRDNGDKYTGREISQETFRQHKSEWRAGQRGVNADDLRDPIFLASLLNKDSGVMVNPGNVTYAPDHFFFFFNNTMAPVAPVQPAALAASIVAHRPTLDFPKINVRAGSVGTNRITVNRDQPSIIVSMSGVRNQPPIQDRKAVKHRHQSPSRVKSAVKARHDQAIPVISAAKAQRQPSVPTQPADQVQRQHSAPVVRRRRPNPIPANPDLENCTKCRIDKKACRGGSENTPCNRCAPMRRICCTRHPLRNTRCLCCLEKKFACAAGASQDSDCQNCIERGFECRKE